MKNDIQEQVFTSNGVSVKYKFRHAKQDRKHLLVIFSGFGAINPVTYNFDGSVLDGCRSHILWIKDEFDGDCTYYICKDMDFSVESTVIALIDSTLKKYGLSKYQCSLLGASKGGSAAIYFGLKYDYKNIIASCPQLYIGSYVKNSWPQSAKNILGSISEDKIAKMDSLIPQLLSLDQSIDRNIYLITSPDDIQYKVEIEPNLHHFSKYLNFNFVVTRSALAWQHNNITRYNVPIILSIILAHGEGIIPRFGMVNNGVPLNHDLNNELLNDGSGVAAVSKCTLKNERLHLSGVAFQRGIPFDTPSCMRRTLVLVSESHSFTSELSSLVNQDINYNYYLSEHVDYRAAGFTLTDKGGFELKKLPDGVYNLHVDMLMGETKRNILTSKPFDIRGLVDQSDVRIVGTESGVTIFKQPLISSYTPTHFTIDKKWQKNSLLHLEGVFAVQGIEVAEWGTIRYYLILKSDKNQFAFELGNAHREKLNIDIGKSMGVYQKAYYATPKFEGISLEKVPNGNYKLFISMAYLGAVFTHNTNEEVLIDESLVRFLTEDAI